MEVKQINNFSELLLKLIDNNYEDVSEYESIGYRVDSYIEDSYTLRYNSNVDGIVYTSFVALGFATVENILYTISGGITTGIVRAVTTVPAHAFFGIISLREK